MGVWKCRGPCSRQSGSPMRQAHGGLEEPMSLLPSILFTHDDKLMGVAFVSRLAA